MGDQTAKDGLEGRVVVVTGSGKGLGAWLARAAAARGARVVVNCRRDTARAEKLAEEIGQTGGRAIACRADVTDPAQAEHLMREALNAFGSLDILVNTVGSFAWKPVEETEPAEWRMILSSNLDSVYNTCRAALPRMREQRWGRIVNFGAVGAERAQGRPKVAPYSAAKAAVVAFSKALALEEARYQITVNVVAPGVLGDSIDAAGARANHASDLSDRMPVGRSGAAEDVARAVFFFTSPEADFVTGQVLTISGGWEL
jgi:NAD(P)-dependent dehydrogenase (short-subunit alcohol dehydrogenase family)